MSLGSLVDRCWSKWANGRLNCGFAVPALAVVGHSRTASVGVSLSSRCHWPGERGRTANRPGEPGQTPGQGARGTETSDRTRRPDTETGHGRRAGDGRGGDGRRARAPGPGAGARAGAGRRSARTAGEPGRAPQAPESERAGTSGTGASRRGRRLRRPEAGHADPRPPVQPHPRPAPAATLPPTEPQGTAQDAQTGRCRRRGHPLGPSGAIRRPRGRHRRLRARAGPPPGRGAL